MMEENNDGRFRVVDDGFVKYIEDTSLKEDKHEGNIYDAYELCRILNDLCEANRVLKLKNDNLVNMCARERYRSDIVNGENEELKRKIFELSEHEV